MPQNNQSSALLSISAISKRFTVQRSGFDRLIARITKQPVDHFVHAVSDVSLFVKRGEVLGIVGESGCGKSTLGRMIAGIYIPSDGEILLDGRPVAKHSNGKLTKLTTKVQMIHQDPFASLNPRMRVGEQIAEGPLQHGIVSHEHIDDRVSEILQQVGLDPSYADRFPHQFSGGQRQRIAIARALAMEPDVLVFDEAVASLDVSIQAQVLNLFLKLRTELNLTAIFISHDLSVVNHVCDRVAIMYLGRVVELADSKELHQQRFHPYSEALYDAMPKLGEGKGVFSPVNGEIPSPMNPPSGCTFHPRCAKASEVCAHTVPSPIEKGSRTYSCHVAFSS